MPYKIHKKDNTHILYSSTWLGSPDALFDPGTQANVSTADIKRGKALFFEYKETPLVLKHYYRGGLIGRMVRDTYVRLPGRAPRMLAEFQLLTQLHEQGFPVPTPIAARCLQPAPMVYQGDLVTQSIPGAHTLHDSLCRRPLGKEQWQAIGETIGRFHAANVYHSDLNVTNILLDEKRKPWLIDFDKGRIRGDGSWKHSNLKRLRRSLDKLQRKTPGAHFCEEDWQALLDGYGTCSTFRQPMYARLGVIALALLS